LAETVEARERLGRLIEDFGELPERQRAALVMRELADLEFAEVGSALETSAAAARQAVYEARVSLRQMEAGREMSCEKVLWELSEADGRVSRRREVQAHLRACAECRAFQASIVRRRGELRAIAPLPVAASAALLQGVLGAGSGAAGGGIAAGAGAGKALLGSTAAKTVATCAVVAAIGTTAADRGGLIDVPIGGDSGPAREGAPPPRPHPVRSVSQSRAVSGSAAAEVRRSAVGRSGQRHVDRGQPAGPGRSRTPTTGAGASPQAAVVPPIPATDHGGGAGTTPPKKRATGHGQGKAAGLPPSSAHGQQTAAAHKSPHPDPSPGTPRGTAKGRSSAPPSPPGHSDSGSEEVPPRPTTAPESPDNGKGSAAAHGAGQPAGKTESLE
jgi:hypothetical protein